MFRRRRHRTEPADRRGADGIADDAFAPLNDFSFFVEREVGQNQILSVRVAGDFMAASVQLLDGFGKYFGALGIQTYRRLDIDLIEDAHEAPNAGFTAVLRP